VFCFDHNVWQEYNYDYTGKYVCRNYQQMVYKFCCQGEKDHWPPVEICFVAIGLLGRAKKISQYKMFGSMTIAG